MVIWKQYPRQPTGDDLLDALPEPLPAKENGAFLCRLTIQADLGAGTEPKIVAAGALLDSLVSHIKSYGVRAALVILDYEDPDDAPRISSIPRGVRG